MAIGFERRQASFISGGDLPQARLANIVPDLSGVQRLAGAFINSGQEADAEKRRLEAEARMDERQRQAIADSRAGGAAGYAAVGMDEKGNYVPAPEMDATKTPEYWRSFYQAFDQGQSSLFETKMTEAFTPIQSKFVSGEINAAQANAMMKSWLEGAISKAPETQRAGWAAAGQNMISQRFSVMAGQEVVKQEKARVDGVQFSISTNMDKAAQIASAGGDPAAALVEIDKGFDTLQGLNLITKEEAEARKALARNYVGAQALTTKINTAMATGELNPAAVDSLATAVETGNPVVEIKGAKPYQVGPNAKSTVETSYKAKDIIEAIDDPKVRGDVGLMLRKSAEDYKQQAAAYAQKKDFLTTFQSLDPNTSLPKHLQDDFDVAMGNMLQQSPIDNEAGWGAIIATVGQAKVMPATLTDQIMGLVGSQDEEKISKAVRLYNMLKTYAPPGSTNMVGDKLIASMPDSAAATLESLSDAAAANMPLVEVMDNIRKGRDGKEWTEQKLITDYNDAHEGKNSSFDTHFRARFAEVYGNGSFPDPDMQASFVNAYRQYYMASRDMDASFEKALGLIQKKFRKSPVTASGWEQGGQSLENPQGYQSTKHSWFGLSQTQPYEWLNSHLGQIVKGHVSDGTLVLPNSRSGPLTGKDIYEMIGWTMAETTGKDTRVPSKEKGFFEWLGSGEARSDSTEGFWLGKDKAGVLIPVPGSNPDYPEYKIRLFKDGEDLGDIKVRNDKGEVVPLIVNPHLDKMQFEDRNEKLFGAHGRITAKQQIEETHKSVEDKLSALKAATMGRLTYEQRQDFDPSAMTFQQYLDAVAPELAGRYKVKTDELIKGFDDMKQKLEDQMQIEVPTEPFSTGALVQPQAAGKNVASAAAQVVDSIAPDGSGGAFLFRVAAQESNYGMAPGTFRSTGDRGLTQISSIGLKEINRRTSIQGDRVQRLAAKLQSGLASKGITVNLMNIQPGDLDQPVVAMAATRLYMEAVGQPLPTSVEGQARWWKAHYNTVAGAGNEQQFIANANAAPSDWKGLMQEASYGPDVTGSGPVSIVYSNQNKVRSLPVQPVLERRLKMAVGHVFGPGYTVEIFSGAQDPKTTGTKGSRRHGDAEQKGLAADVYIVAPNGKRVMDANRLTVLADYWEHNGMGSVGTFMDGMGMHLDLFTADMLRPGESTRWTY